MEISQLDVNPHSCDDPGTVMVQLTRWYQYYSVDPCNDYKWNMFEAWRKRAKDLGLINE